MTLVSPPARFGSESESRVTSLWPQRASAPAWGYELVLFRVNDGVEESVEDIMALPQEEGSSKVTPVGGTFAPPGRTIMRWPP